MGLDAEIAPERGASCRLAARFALRGGDVIVRSERDRDMGVGWDCRGGEGKENVIGFIVAGPEMPPKSRRFASKMAVRFARREKVRGMLKHHHATSSHRDDQMGMMLGRWAKG